MNCTVFDSAKTDKKQVALVLAPVTSKSEQLTGVPFTITRQVEGQRPVKSDNPCSLSNRFTEENGLDPKNLGEQTTGTDALPL